MVDIEIDVDLSPSRGKERDEYDAVIYSIYDDFKNRTKIGFVNDDDDDDDDDDDNGMRREDINFTEGSGRV